MKHLLALFSWAFAFYVGTATAYQQVEKGYVFPKLHTSQQKAKKVSCAQSPEEELTFMGDSVFKKPTLTICCHVEFNGVTCQKGDTSEHLFNQPLKNADKVVTFEQMGCASTDEGVFCWNTFEDFVLGKFEKVRGVDRVQDMAIDASQVFLQDTKGSVFEITPPEYNAIPFTYDPQLKWWDYRARKHSPCFLTSDELSNSALDVSCYVSQWRTSTYDHDEPSQQRCVLYPRLLKCTNYGKVSEYPLAHNAKTFVMLFNGKEDGIRKFESYIFYYLTDNGELYSFGRKLRHPGFPDSAYGEYVAEIQNSPEKILAINAPGGRNTYGFDQMRTDHIGSSFGRISYGLVTYGRTGLNGGSPTTHFSSFVNVSNYLKYLADKSSGARAALFKSLLTVVPSGHCAPSSDKEFELEAKTFLYWISNAVRSGSSDFYENTIVPGYERVVKFQFGENENSDFVLSKKATLKIQQKVLQLSVGFLATKERNDLLQLSRVLARMQSAPDDVNLLNEFLAESERVHGILLALQYSTKTQFLYTTFYQINEWLVELSRVSVEPV